MHITIEIKSADDVTDRIKDILDEMYQREFGRDPMIYDMAQWYLLGLLDEDPVGQVGILQREISVGESLFRVGGIHGVVTEPKHRGHGVASVLMRRSIDFIKSELHLPFGLLTCKPRLETFYSRLGWKTAKDLCVFEQPDGLHSCGGLTMVIECGAKPWPEGEIDLRGLPW
jgi:GNAT superfamily N-acetyltransferase